MQENIAIIINFEKENLVIFYSSNLRCFKNLVYNSVSENITEKRDKKLMQ